MNQAPLVEKMKHIRAMQAAMRGKAIYKDNDKGEFVGGGKWEIVTQFKGKSHEDGGIDLEVMDGYVRKISGREDSDDIAKNGRVWRDIGAGAYGIGEGMLDTITMGATDELTDWGYRELQKAGGSTEDEMREQDSIRGYGMAGGAIGAAVLTGGGNIGTTIQQSAKGIGMGVSKGSPDSKFAQQVGVWLPVAGNIAGMAFGNKGYAAGSTLSNVAKYARYGGQAFKLGRAALGNTGESVKNAEKGMSGADAINTISGQMLGYGGPSFNMGVAPSLASKAQRDVSYGGSPLGSGGGASTEQDMFYAQVPMREDTLSQLTRYNINV